MKYLYTLLLLCSVQLCNAQYTFNRFNISPVGDASIQELTVVGSKLYFSAFYDSTGREPYISDGTLAGTHILKDIATTYNSSSPRFFTAYNGKVYFNASSYAHSNELWVTDGTEAGTQEVMDIYPAGSGGNPQYLTVYNGKLIFQATNYNEGNEIWITDGTTSGTQLLKDINPGTVNSQPSEFTLFNGKLYFAANDATNGRELWETDGTAAGTKLAVDIFAGTQSSGPSKFIVMNGKLFFQATTYSGRELWATDGTAAGTYMVKDIAPGVTGGVSILTPTVLNNQLIFNANDASHGEEMWVTDGTTAGTYMLADIYPGSNSSYSSSYTLVYKNKVYFTANNGFGTNGYELWETDGTSAGTKLACDVLAGTNSSFPILYCVYNGYMFMIANQGPAGDKQLYVSDGTCTGTHVIATPTVTNANPLFANFINNNPWAVYNGSLYLGANYDTAGAELWSVTSPSSVKPIEKNNGFIISPNPSDGNFTIELNDANFTEATVTVYDIMGRMMKSEKLISTSETIHLDAPKGIYLVKLQVDDAVMTKRIVVE